MKCYLIRFDKNLLISSMEELGNSKYYKQIFYNWLQGADVSAPKMVLKILFHCKHGYYLKASIFTVGILWYIFQSYRVNSGDIHSNWNEKNPLDQKLNHRLWVFRATTQTTTLSRFLTSCTDVNSGPLANIWPLRSIKHSNARENGLSGSHYQRWTQFQHYVVLDCKMKRMNDEK